MHPSNASAAVATEWALQGLSSPPSSSPSTEADLCSVSLSGSQIKLIPVLYCVLFVLGLVGNSLVIIVLWQQRSLKNVPTVYILNLAVVDLLALATLPLWAVYYAYGYNWLFGSTMCKVSSSVLSLTTFASIFFITCMSLNRHQAILHPFQSQQGTLQRAFATVLLVWGFATLTSLPTFYFRDTRDIPNLNVTACVMAFPAETYSRWSAGMALMKSTVGFLIPLAIIVTCYIRIGVHLLRAQRFGRNRQQTDRVLKLVAAVVVAFLSCWLPFHVLTFLDALVSLEVIRDCWVTSVIDEALPFGLLMGFTNNCINPLLYYFIGSQFQEKLQRLFKLRLYQFKNTRQSLCSVKTSFFQDAETPVDDVAQGEEAVESSQTHSLWVP
ncbi:type-2 angiotensin II receptor [Tiliqua scincoides]|uniref:type-2 angiotensin II receptor n=1 Tax=Tiliqua scincoides TaxID=71010 RepID=UPI0034626778